MRKEDIKDLIAEAKEIQSIIVNYTKIPKPKVKTILEHLRSCLEYAIYDINSKLSSPRPVDRLYFPYAENLKNFDATIDKKFPLLKTEFPEVYNEMVKLHDFKDDTSWIKILCDLTNYTKHKGAIPINHESEVFKSTLISIGGKPLFDLGPDAKLEVIGGTYKGKSFDDFVIVNDQLSITKKGDLSFDFKITKDKKILVGDDSIDLIPFLSHSTYLIENFCTNLYLLI